MMCRHCQTAVNLKLADLRTAPPSNSYLNQTDLARPERYYPLKVLVCESCWLAQTEDYADASEFFSPDYAYFSSFSKSWLKHASDYVKVMTDRFSLNDRSMVAEIAANDGYLLQYVRERGIPCYGIEPTASTATAARAKGIKIVEDFFGVKLANELANQGQTADLIAANNVLAHVPNINDFVTGFSVLLKPNGVATFEFPHLLNLMRENQFDTIYHEHFSYLSLSVVNQIFAKNGLTVFDVDTLTTHGGSLRVFAQRTVSGQHKINERVGHVLKLERDEGMLTREYYTAFQPRIDKLKNDLLLFLIESKNKNKKVVAYGAAAKGNTLLNYAGVQSDLLTFVVDRNTAKIGKFMPGSRIAIVDESEIQKFKPDYVLILPWNLREEITEQLKYIRQWDAKFVAAVPELRIG